MKYLKTYENKENKDVIFVVMYDFNQAAMYINGKLHYQYSDDFSLSTAQETVKSLGYNISHFINLDYYDYDFNYKFPEHISDIESIVEGGKLGLM